ncbi:hypothetical protein DL762_009862 [Monosporascus cannonballus]|uniref:HMG box domain-containing protein n=1 Tax=Monosporascus cannonballus TaxID=155416 RepID=A0ABY0GS64_9PEZI|nr:hypothetical protein DL762_009862 [Monosporascus cannonballus]
MYGQINSNPQSGYSSPTPHYQQPAMHQSPYPYPPETYQPGYAVDNSPYPPPPEALVATPHAGYSTPATSPPTPLQSDGMRTRSGKAIRTSQASSMSRQYRADPYTKPSPKPKAKGGAKKKKQAKEDDGEFIMDAPLSVLCEEMANVKEIDIDAYAKRTVEERRNEVLRSKNGKTKRPSNAFMLYRKAYQNRAKEVKKHDNHQVVSKVCGSSWKREQPAVKAYFNELARIESELHREAFPDYKFTPAKAKNKKGKDDPVGRISDADDSELELADYDYAAGQPPSRTASRGLPRYDSHPDAEYVPPGAAGGRYPDPYARRSPHRAHAQHQRIHFEGQPPPQHISSYEYSNPGRPKPQPYGSLTVQGQYLQRTAEMAQPMYPHQHPHQQHPHYPANVARMPYGHIENVYMHRTDSPIGTTYAGGSPVTPPHLADGYGGMVSTMYGAPPPHHQHPHPHPRRQHGLAPPPPQQQPQNIDPSLMPAPRPHQQEEHVGSSDPFDGPLGIYGADGGGVVVGGYPDDSLGVHGGQFHAYPLDPHQPLSSLDYPGGGPDPVYQPTPYSSYQQQLAGEDGGAGTLQPHAGDESDLWKIAPTSLEDPFDFDLLDHRSPKHTEDGGDAAAGEGSAAANDGSGT